MGTKMDTVLNVWAVFLFPYFRPGVEEGNEPPGQPQARFGVRHFAHPVAGGHAEEHG